MVGSTNRPRRNAAAVATSAWAETRAHCNRHRNGQTREELPPCGWLPPAPLPISADPQPRRPRADEPRPLEPRLGASRQVTHRPLRILALDVAGNGVEHRLVVGVLFRLEAEPGRFQAGFLLRDAFIEPEIQQP